MVYGIESKMRRSGTYYPFTFSIRLSPETRSNGRILIEDSESFLVIDLLSFSIECNCVPELGPRNLSRRMGH